MKKNKKAKNNNKIDKASIWKISLLLFKNLYYKTSQTEMWDLMPESTRPIFRKQRFLLRGSYNFGDVRKHGTYELEKGK